MVCKLKIGICCWVYLGVIIPWSDFIFFTFQVIEPLVMAWRMLKWVEKVQFAQKCNFYGMKMASLLQSSLLGSSDICMVHVVLRWVSCFRLFMCGWRGSGLQNQNRYMLLGLFGGDHPLVRFQFITFQVIGPLVMAWRDVEMGRKSPVCSKMLF